jgi:3-phosphoglycerate kinase
MIPQLENMDVAGKHVLVRAGMDVPVDDQGNIQDEVRISEAIPTLEYLVKKKAMIIVLTHIGRPEGKVVEKYRVGKVAKRLAELLGIDVQITGDCIGKEAEDAVASMRPGEVLLLENLRFHAEEQENNEAFAAELASFGEVYVNDAFNNSHHTGASMVMLPKLIPACAGFLLRKELDTLSSLFASPKRPLVAVLGGLKLKDKIGVVQNLLEKVDTLIIGGALAFTFLKAKGMKIGASKCDDSLVEQITPLLVSPKLVLPVDIVIARNITAGAEHAVVPIGEIPEGWKGVDIGPETVKKFTAEIAKARSIVWSGDMGVFEIAEFSHGTTAIAHAVAGRKTAVIGGGDTLLAAGKVGILSKVKHASTGGSAMLRFLEGKPLPAIAAMEQVSNQPEEK